MNKLAQGYGLFGYFFSLLFFIVVWFVWLGGWINDVGNYMIQQNALTGIEAMICANLNLVLMIVIFISIVGYQYFRA